ncbi:MAG TPA: UbiX family flavin prenyltransferase [Thermodesulfobacteriota bacterium]|nr:UbiX family flavin prenyltransferase [Thermodesulfobacteriota bacterium]
MRTIVGITGASGVVYGVDFLRKCPDDKFLVVSKWGKRVLQEELGLKVEEISPWVKKTFNDWDLAAPFSSGSNHFDSLVIIPCSVSTLGKIASGIADTLITRAAQVALKERRRLVIALRETPLSSIALENALKLSREGAIIMPISPPHYIDASTVNDLVEGFVNKVLKVIGIDDGSGWRQEDLE